MLLFMLPECDMVGAAVKMVLGLKQRGHRGDWTIGLNLCRWEVRVGGRKPALLKFGQRCTERHRVGRHDHSN